MRRSHVMGFKMDGTTIGLVASYCSTLTISLLVNKYVLSVLHFTYPTIFQGWQVLVGGMLLKSFTFCSFGSNGNHFKITEMDKPGFISLFPSFLFFVLVIVSGSKALASLPLPIFLSVESVTTVVSLLLKKEQSWRALGPIHLGAVGAVFVTASLIILVELDITFSDSPYFWMLMHVVFSVALDMHYTIADARYSDLDRLYFSYVASMVILAPASLYLEEAFEALKFAQNTEMQFLLGCIISGVSGLVMNLCAVHLSSLALASKIRCVSKLSIALLSVFLFTDSFSVTVSVLVTINLFSTLFLPSSQKLKERESDTEILNETV